MAHKLCKFTCTIQEDKIIPSVIYLPMITKLYCICTTYVPTFFTRTIYKIYKYVTFYTYMIDMNLLYKLRHLYLCHFSCTSPAEG